MRKPIQLSQAQREAIRRQARISTFGSMALEGRISQTMINEMSTYANDYADSNEDSTASESDTW